MTTAHLQNYLLVMPCREEAQRRAAQAAEEAAARERSRPAQPTAPPPEVDRAAVAREKAKTRDWICSTRRRRATQRMRATRWDTFPISMHAPLCHSAGSWAICSPMQEPSHPVMCTGPYWCGASAYITCARLCKDLIKNTQGWGIPDTPSRARRR